MSTRGCVAVKTGENSWRGVYNHCDSYPTYLGREVWAILHDYSTNKQFCDELLQFDDWRNFLNEGICEYCGKRTSQPHSISIPICGFDSEYQISPRNEEEVKMLMDYRNTGYPDPEAKYHKHNTEDLINIQITNETTEPLWHEWVYVIDVEKNKIEVLYSRLVEDELPDQIKYEKSNYAHFKAAEIDIDGPEPNWEEIESLRYGE